jgi:hypothetical protein
MAICKTEKMGKLILKIQIFMWIKVTDVHYLMLGVQKLSYTENDHLVGWGGEGEFWERKTDETGSLLCPVMRFDIIGVGSSGSIIIHLVQH